MNKSKLLLQCVQVVTGVTQKEIESKGRKRHVVDARKMYCGLLYEIIGTRSISVNPVTLEGIAKIMRGSSDVHVDHAIVLHYIKGDDDLTETNNMYRMQRDQVIERFRSKLIDPFTAKDAWNAMWGEVVCNAILI